jgi:FkbM family methyltransferase
MSFAGWVRRHISVDQARVQKLQEVKDELTTVRDRLAAVTARARALKGAEERAAKAERDAEHDRARLDKANADRMRLRRQMLSPAPLAGLVAARRPLFPRPGVRAEGAAREAQFRRVCAAYAAEVDRPWPRPGVEPIDIGGLRLWVPLDERQPERIERASHQDIPYAAILQSREVALGGLMLDIGANLGRTSLPRALLGDVRAVYAAEADADNFACLVHAVVDNGVRGFVLPDHLAIAAADGTATLRRSRFVGGHRLVAEGRKKHIEVATVRTRRVDTWLDELGIDPADVSFVKVDVQGWEPGVLGGAAGLLGRRTAAWQLEIDGHLLKLAGSSIRELVALASPHFTHFVDLRENAPGERHRPVAELGEALGYLPEDRSDGTDVILYCAR